MLNETTNSNEKSPFSGSRYRNQGQIESLYHEFESLKSQIYGFEEKSGLRSSHHKKDSLYKDKAAFFLQSSTIKKYELELANHLQSIHKEKELSSSRKKDKKSTIYQRSSMRKKNSQQNNEFSKVLSQYRSQKEVAKEGKTVNKSDAKVQKDICEQLQKSQALFYQLINDSSKMFEKTKKDGFSFDQIKTIFEQFSNNYLQMLLKVDDTLKFLNQKLRCLQLVFQQFSKIRKIQEQTKARNIRKEKTMMIDVERIEHMYDSQMKTLTEFYERKNKELELKYQEKIIVMQNEIQNEASINSDSEKKSLKSLLDKAKNVISTKEELIFSLQEENEELRVEIAKLKVQLEKEKEKEVELGYSSTTQKIQKEMAQISAIKKIVNINPRDHVQEEDDINFSELGSIKDSQSLSEWDNSLDLQHSKIQKNKSSKGGPVQKKQLTK